MPHFYRVSMTHTPTSSLRIAVLGTGNIAQALGSLWAVRGHSVVFGGRSIDNSRPLSFEVGEGTTFTSLVDAAHGADVVLLAIPWAGVDDVLSKVAHVLDGTTVLDPTNPVEHGVGRHLLPDGSAAEHIAHHIPGAHVVKAFNVHPASYWATATADDVVTLAGDDPAALDHARRLVRETGATPHVLGGLNRARQVEVLAGTIIGLAFAGIDPRRAVPGARGRRRSEGAEHSISSR